MKRAKASDRTIMTPDEFLAIYRAHKEKVEAEKQAKEIKPRRFVEVPKRTRKIVNYNAIVDCTKFETVTTKKNVIANYAVIDQVGSLQGADFSAIYNKVAERAETEGFTYKDKTLLTLRKLCVKSYNPYAKKPICWKDSTGRTVYDEEKVASMKFAMRYNKSPKKVYFICYELNNTTEREIKKWAERGIPVEVHETMTNQRFEYKDFSYSHQFTNETKYPIQRAWTERWAPAFGDSFIAPEPYRLLKDRQPSTVLPLTRFMHENEIDVYALGNRERRRQLQRDGVEISKITSTPQKFLEQQRCIVPDETVHDYVNKKAIMKRFIDTHPHTTDPTIYWTSEGIDFEEMLEVDKVICPHCGQPMNPHNHKDANQRETEFIICTNCETHFDEDDFGIYPEFEPYYEYSADEFDNWLDDITESEDSYYAEDFECE